MLVYISRTFLFGKPHPLAPNSFTGQGGKMIRRSHENHLKKTLLMMHTNVGHICYIGVKLKILYRKFPHVYMRETAMCPNFITYS